MQNITFEGIPGVFLDDDEYAELQESLEFVSCLEACGVDNWEGYEYALEMFQEGK